MAPRCFPRRRRPRSRHLDASTAAFPQSRATLSLGTRRFLNPARPSSLPATTLSPPHPHAGAPGTFSGTGSTPCSNCAANTFSSAYGSTICAPCPGGTASSAGAAACSTGAACPPGTYSSALGSTSCLACPAGKWSGAGAVGAAQCCATPANAVVTVFAEPTCTTVYATLLAVPGSCTSFASSGGVTATALNFGWAALDIFFASGLLPPRCVYISGVSAASVNASAAACTPGPGGLYFKMMSSSCAVVQPIVAALYASNTTNQNCNSAPLATFTVAAGTVVGSAIPCQPAAFQLTAPASGMQTTMAVGVSVLGGGATLSSTGGAIQVFASTDSTCVTTTQTLPFVLNACSGLSAYLTYSPPQAYIAAAWAAVAANTSYAIVGNNFSTCPIGPGFFPVTVMPACAPGYTPSLLGLGASCIACSAGFFKATAGSQACLPCNPGSYPNALTAASSCTACPAGTWASTANIYTPTTSAANCIPCPAGSFLDVSPGGTACTPCLAPTWNGTAGAVGLASCSLCQAGFFLNASASGGFNNCSTCPAYSYNSVVYQAGDARFLGSPAAGIGPGSCLPCAAGQAINSAVAGTSCATCAAGYASGAGLTRPAVGACGICPAGSYAFAGAASCSQCALGTYSPTAGAQSSALCLSCGAGYYSTVPAATSFANCTACPVGTWSAALTATSNATCTQCGFGTYSSTFAATSVSACVGCGPGLYAAVRGLSSPLNCSSCPMGTWSGAQVAVSAASCVSCGAGYWSSTPGAGSQSVCQPCGAGWYSSIPVLGYQAQCMGCPAGTYSTTLAATSSAACVPCPAGTYSTLVNQSSAAVCVPCGQGYYSTTTGNSNVNQCVACPAGTWSNLLVATSLSMCTSCSSGYYSTATAATLISTCLPCPAGTYNPVYGANSQSYCLDCLYRTSMRSPISCPAGSSSQTNCGAGNVSVLAAEPCAPPCPVRAAHMTAYSDPQCTLPLTSIDLVPGFCTIYSSNLPFALGITPVTLPDYATATVQIYSSSGNSRLMEPFNMPNSCDPGNILVAQTLRFSTLGPYGVGKYRKSIRRCPPLPIDPQLQTTWRPSDPRAQDSVKVSRSTLF